MLRQLASAGQTVRLSPAAAALAPTGWPVSGPISSQFGPRISPIDEELRFHAGVDIAVPVGTPVKATQAGEVVQAGANGAYGLAVVVRHEGGFETLYAHNSVVPARVGQRVERGEIIAYAGNTGVSTGPHLHYEVHYQGRPIDPEPVLRAGGR
jgi:murein DD-endopeptidase MepM/ murein hydrolase activator NlpD